MMSLRKLSESLNKSGEIAKPTGKMKRNRPTFLAVAISILMLLAAFHTFPVRASPSSLVNFWPADGTAEDVVGGNDGTLINGATYGPGITDQAFSFNGINQYVQALYAVPFGSNDFSIDLWANFNLNPPSAITNPSSIFIADDNGGGCNDKWFFALGGGVLNFHINTAPSCAGLGFFAQYPWAPNLHQWYNLAVTRQAGTIRIYINGAQVSSEYTASTSNPTVPLIIGYGEGVVGYFNGLLDDIRIYNRALAAGEIQAISGACNEADGNGDFHGSSGKGNFNADDDKCEDGIPNQVSSTNVGDGKDFQSTQISTTTFDAVANTVTITGLGTHGGVPVAFTFVALETGPTTPGWVSFAFSDGYTNAGTLVSGSILLH